MRSIFLVRTLGVLGLKVPDTLAIRLCEWGLAALVPIFFTDDVAGLIRQPFSISETFSVQMIGDEFLVKKSPTERAGEFQIYFCTHDGVNSLMGVAYYGAFTRREETFALIVDTRGHTLDRSKPVTLITNVYLESSQTLFSRFFEDDSSLGTIEVFDPTRKSRVSFTTLNQDVHDCGTAETLVEMRQEG